MNKENIYKVLYAISIVLLIGFVISLVADYMQYNTFVNSAPFYMFVLVRVVEFIVPGIGVFIVARVVKQKNNKESI